jgi:hypothetical protein
VALVDTAAVMKLRRTATRLSAGAVVVAVVVVLAGCGTSQGTVTLGAAKPSVIQGLPVPTQASLIHVTNQHGASGAGYIVPVPLAALNKWYERHLPSGEAWRTWAWHSMTGPRCLDLVSGPGTTRQWVQQGKLLMIATTGHAGGSSTEPSFINIDLLPYGSLFNCG